MLTDYAYVWGFLLSLWTFFFLKTNKKCIIPFLNFNLKIMSGKCPALLHFPKFIRSAQILFTVSNIAAQLPLGYSIYRYVTSYSSTKNANGVKSCARARWIWTFLDMMLTSSFSHFCMQKLNFFLFLFFLRIYLTRKESHLKEKTTFRMVIWLELLHWDFSAKWTSNYLSTTTNQQMRIIFNTCLYGPYIFFWSHLLCGV